MSAGRDKNARLAWTMVAIVGGMLGLAYAAVPLYQAFCKATGFAGTPLIAREGERPVIDQDQLDAAAAEALAPFEAAAAGTEPEHPYALHQELQQTMNDLVGIIRRAGEMKQALDRLAVLRRRAGAVVVEGHRQFNPGWHLALDLQNMLLVSECVAKAALIREESRGGHTRDDFPEMSPEWRKVNLICSVHVGDDGTWQADVVKQPLPVMPPELLGLFDRTELSKYLTPEELTVLPEATQS